MDGYPQQNPMNNMAQSLMMAANMINNAMTGPVPMVPPAPLLQNQPNWRHMVNNGNGSGNGMRQGRMMDDYRGGARREERDRSSRRSDDRSNRNRGDRGDRRERSNPRPSAKSAATPRDPDTFQPRRTGSANITKDKPKEQQVNRSKKTENTPKKEPKKSGCFVCKGEHHVKDCPTPVDREKWFDATDDSLYKGLPASLLCCFICNKDFWTGAAFQHHIETRSHKEMTLFCAEQHMMMAGIMRHQSKLKDIRDFKMARDSGKKQGYCNMCDTDIHTTMQQHRQTRYHTQLRKFLHPHCRVCKENFQERLAYDAHRLSEQHLRKFHSSGITKIHKDYIELFNFQVLTDSGEPNSRVGGNSKGNKDNKDVPAMSKEQTLEMKKLNDANIGSYKVPEVGKRVGSSYVRPVNGSFCRLCKKFLNAELVGSHLKCKEHHGKFSQAVANKKEEAKAKNAEKAKKETTAEKEKEVDDEKGTETTTRPSNTVVDGDDQDDDSGNWKRQKKTAVDKEEEEEEEEEKKPAKEAKMDEDGNNEAEPEVDDAAPMDDAEREQADRLLLSEDEEEEEAAQPQEEAKEQKEEEEAMQVDPPKEESASEAPTASESEAEATKTDGGASPAKRTRRTRRKVL